MRVRRMAIVPLLTLLFGSACATLESRVASGARATEPARRYAWDARDRGLLLDPGTRALLRGEVAAHLEAQGWQLAPAESASVYVTAELLSTKPLTHSGRWIPVMSAHGMILIGDTWDSGPGHPASGSGELFPSAFDVLANPLGSMPSAGGVSRGGPSADGEPFADADGVSVPVDTSVVLHSRYLRDGRLVLAVRARDDSSVMTRRRMARSASVVPTLRFWGDTASPADTSFTRRRLEVVARPLVDELVRLAP